MQDEIITIANDVLTARIAFLGAELRSLVPDWGGDVIWEPDASIWDGAAPNLFPVVGTLVGDRLIHKGVAYPMAGHGFLRHHRMTPVSVGETSGSFRLRDTVETRRSYPFPFDLTVSFSLEGDRLRQSFLVANPGEEPLPVSLGAHPGFRWPLSPSLPRSAHRILFSHDEPGGIRRVVKTGAGPALGRALLPTPVSGRVLCPEDALFAPGAIVWDRRESDRISFGVPDGPGVEMECGDFPHFGIWTKPGAGFLCLEPWQGFMSPPDFAGEIRNRPGIAMIPPGDSRRWSLSIRPVRHLSTK